MSLTTAGPGAFRRDGHVTVAHVSPSGEIDRALAGVNDDAFVAEHLERWLA